MKNSRSKQFDPSYLLMDSGPKNHKPLNKNHLRVFGFVICTILLYQVIHNLQKFTILFIMSF